MSKGLEALKVIYNSQDILGGYDDFWEAYRTIEKELKALEIIKEKQVDVEWFKRTNNSYSYNQGILISGGSCGALTHEEYELLTEVLQNDN